MNTVARTVVARTVADVVDAVIGVDTHLDTHSLEMVAPNGVTLATLQVDTTDEGLARVVSWIGEHAPGPRVMAALEGARSYGITLNRVLTAAGIPVGDVQAPEAKQRRKGKSDAIDARAAALRLLATDLDKLPIPRADGDREALRMLLTGRLEQSDTRTRQANALHALLASAEQDLRALGKGKFSNKTLRQLAALPAPDPDAPWQQKVQHGEITRLAAAILALDEALNANDKQLTAIVTQLLPSLLDEVGVGPVVAARILVTFSHPARFRNEGSFAMLTGTAPIPATSGKRQNKHRLNRGGDRLANNAIHTVVMTRWRCCPDTQAYIARRRAEGLTDRDIRRCLKRYVSRQLFRHLNQAMAHA